MSMASYVRVMEEENDRLKERIDELESNANTINIDGLKVGPCMVRNYRERIDELEASIRKEQPLSLTDYMDREWTSKIMSRKELKINQTGESVKNSYILIMHTDPEYFSELIEVHLVDGWVLVGGPFVFNGDTFCQAMSE